MSKLSALHQAMSRLDGLWADADDAADLSRDRLIAVHSATGELRRLLDAVHADVAAVISQESRSELGAGGLAKQQGFRSAETMIAATTGVSRVEATRLVAVGEATASRADLRGSRLPARYPALGEALTAGRLGVQAAGLIVALLERCRISAGTDRIAEAERILTDKATGLSLDDVRRLVTRADAWLDPDGLEPKGEEMRRRRSLTMFERDGMLHLDARIDIETAAPIVAAIRGYVTAAFAARKDAPDANAPDADAPYVDRRTVPMLQIDALALFCAHVLGCEGESLPLAGATVVVRITLDDLQSGTGCATIDGLDQKVSVGAARRMAANGGVIPCVLGGGSEILDWGREKRLFTRAQRLALVERDGGCAMCGLPPQMTKAHHLRWWSRDHGPTDLSNGVLLCETCHHRIHDNGWEIRIDGEGVAGKVWFIPPEYVDPECRPRLGGRARFDMAA
ncbi:HNH endonuclease signature motif containing protein [Microbacterium foliorum]|uniref:HNH endonuclease signature motif containing protein n=1 Tax=Microbacterium foliorum TaxID=104336 RepID=UPI001D59D624|nr:HNH endonuclease signature motif containing protein [Microbacterium foliorum]CAH0142686.1 hypothetical protein SRABI44_00515 [Microbacterium foliorum]CAH0245489.1 hypothetical protein SRABI03_03080 [Microbacterium foliorum]